jgi:asparagine synthase (glutamine-hydrolysing)
MSAVCALMRLDGAPVAGARLDPVLEALEGWGETPSVWAGQTEGAPVALGCRVHRVTPEDGLERQPVVSADGTFVLVADARIDNRSDLARALGLGASKASALADSALILAAYEAWGEDCVRRLVGDFVFLLWDARRHALFAARDAIGQRVLFYHGSAKWLSLASSAAALLALDHAPAALNEQKVADFLVLQQDPETTFFRGVQRLPAGHSLVATPAGIRVRRYWSALPARDVRFPRENDYLEAFHEVFGLAVEARLRSAGPVGIMLSAGLDSSTVAAVAARQLAARGDRLLAWHAAPRAGFEGAVRPGWVADESEDVRAIARLHPNIDLEIQRTGGRTPLEDLDTLFRVTGMPVRNVSNRGWVESIYLAAQKRGVRVLLSGQKGNATISYTGLLSLRDLARAGHWAHVLQEIRAVARVTGQRPRTVFKDQILPALLPGWVYAGWARVRGTRAEPLWEARLSAIRPEFARQMQVEERARARHEDDFNMDRAGGFRYRAMILAAGDALDNPHGLRGWFGVETRDPTSDRRVVEFCLGLPPAQYLRRGRGRQLVRRSMRGLLPEAVLERDTRGAQAADCAEWLPSLRPAIVRELEELQRSGTAQRCIDLPRLRRLVDQWPERLGTEHMAEYDHLLLRGIMMGRFLTWFESSFGPRP